MKTILKLILKIIWGVIKNIIIIALVGIVALLLLWIFLNSFPITLFQ